MDVHLKSLVASMSVVTGDWRTGNSEGVVYSHRVYDKHVRHSRKQCVCYELRVESTLLEKEGTLQIETEPLDWNGRQIKMFLGSEDSESLQIYATWIDSKSSGGGSSLREYSITIVRENHRQGALILGPEANCQTVPRSTLQDLHIFIPCRSHSAVFTTAKFCLPWANIRDPSEKLLSDDRLEVRLQGVVGYKREMWSVSRRENTRTIQWSFPLVPSCEKRVSEGFAVGFESFLLAFLLRKSSETEGRSAIVLNSLSGYSGNARMCVRVINQTEKNDTLAIEQNLSFTTRSCAVLDLRLKSDVLLDKTVGFVANGLLELHIEITLQPGGLRHGQGEPGLQSIQAQEQRSSGKNKSFFGTELSGQKPEDQGKCVFCFTNGANVSLVHEDDSQCRVLCTECASRHNFEGQYRASCPRCYKRVQSVVYH